MSTTHVVCIMHILIKYLVVPNHNLGVLPDCDLFMYFCSLASWGLILDTLRGLLALNWFTDMLDLLLSVCLVAVLLWRNMHYNGRDFSRFLHTRVSYQLYLQETLICICFPGLTLSYWQQEWYSHLIKIFACSPSINEGGIGIEFELLSQFQIQSHISPFSFLCSICELHMYFLLHLSFNLYKPSFLPCCLLVKTCMAQGFISAAPCYYPTNFLYMYHSL